MNKLALSALLFLLSVPAMAANSVEAIAIDAALGKPTALYNLGVEFYTGKRVPQDYSKSAALWERASSLGIVSAKNNLGFLLFNGKGVKQDRVRAVALWREAASSGHDEAQWHLGLAIHDGTGTKRDKITGIAWVICAYKNAVSVRDPAIVELASKSRDELLRHLTEEQRRRAVLLADKLFNDYPPRRF